MGRPRLNTDEQRREKRRIKSAKWRAENRERSREITRDSERRRAATRAAAEGREPGRIGRTPKFSEDEKREKRKEKANRYYRQHAAKLSALTAEHQRLARAGLYEPKPFKKLTSEERKRRDVALSHNRRARKRDAGGTHTAADIAELRERQKDKCAFCLKTLGAEVHIDHYVPLALGGRNDRGNLRLLHPTCNLAKGAKHPAEHALENGLLCW